MLPLRSFIEHLLQLLEQLGRFQLMPKSFARFFLLVLFLPAMGCFQSMPKSFGSQNAVIVPVVRDLNMDAIVALGV
jgi:hypothetical protein